MREMSESLIKKIADFSMLELTQEEGKILRGQLEEILNYIEKLQEIEVDGVEPLFYPIDQMVPGNVPCLEKPPGLCPEKETHLREDRAQLDPDMARRLLNSKDSEVIQGGFKVPPLF